MTSTEKLFLLELLDPDCRCGNGRTQHSCQWSAKFPKTWEESILRFYSEGYDNLARQGNSGAYGLAASLLVQFGEEVEAWIHNPNCYTEEEVKGWRMAFEAKFAEHGERMIPHSFGASSDIRPHLGPYEQLGEDIADRYNRLWQLLLNINSDVVSDENWATRVLGEIGTANAPGYLCGAKAGAIIASEKAARRARERGPPPRLNAP